MNDLTYEQRKQLRRLAEDARDAANRRFGPFVDAVAHPLNILALLDMAERSHHRAVRVPPAQMTLTTAELAVIVRLINLAANCYTALDDAEEFEGDHGRCHSISSQNFDDLCQDLDALDALPDDRPGLVLGPAGKAEWALRRLLGIDCAKAEEAGKDAGQ